MPKYFFTNEKVRTLARVRIIFGYIFLLAPIGLFWVAVGRTKRFVLTFIGFIATIIVIANLSSFSGKVVGYTAVALILLQTVYAVIRMPKLVRRAVIEHEYRLWEKEYSRFFRGDYPQERYPNEVHFGKIPDPQE